MRARTFIGAATLLGALLGGCVPSVEPGQYTCDPSTGGDCPEGMICIPNGVRFECWPVQPNNCGDGVQDLGEQCDGTDIPGSCVDYGFAAGHRQCTSTCTALCTSCGNGATETGPYGEGEGCDDANQLSRDGCSADCREEELAWRLRDRTSDPSARYGHALAYDAHRERVVLFGGVTDASPLGDTWEHDGETWVRVDTLNAPPARFHHTLVYDAGRGRVVLFGGTQDANAGLEDTWEYDGVDWAQVDTPTTPGPRFAAAAAYEPELNRIILFGGIHGGADRLGTWELDGATWSEVATNGRPTLVTQATLTWVPPLQGLVLFGGSRSFTTRVSVNDTWLYRDSTWEQLTLPAPPPKREAHAAFFDPRRQRLVIVGGATKPDLTYLADVWELDGETWVELSVAENPVLPARAAPGQYLTHVEGALLFGGWAAASSASGSDASWWLQYRLKGSVCGNGQREPEEICDGDDIAPEFGLDCEVLGFSGGTLACRDDCRLDLDRCYE